MSVAREQGLTRTSPPRALDRLFAAYLILSGIALLFPHRPAGWLWIGALHIVAVLVLLRTPPFDALLASLRERAPRLARAAHDWYALLLIPALYTELAVLNRSVWDGRYFDELIIRLETLFFGGQPSQSLAATLPKIWLSEPLHFAYLSYYLIIFGPPLLLYLRSRTHEFRATTFTLMLTFFAHYLFFVYFPVQGPRYLFPAPLGGIENGTFYQLAHRVLEAGSSQGSAFPSSHVGVSIAQTLCVARFMPRLMVPVALLTVGLAVGAVYGGFHYAIDAVLGAALGALMVLIAPSLQRALQGEQE
ncbi:MAG: phosphatase PAP2 family protein [Candidatus Cloacimonetes bacterium]|jgi:membrane-associated phospholipid phosphatase|nr:phosphatase PAP2 family protein [Candidatus Cloacimonadota bacterium]